ncbi:hypothetical protein BZA77DRAFT_340882 [Pyronema omphalodes]|nr:hypothetical protein BZA77DRAFT_340882 [Pyronema omphalodes]
MPASMDSLPPEILRMILTPSKEPDLQLFSSRADYPYETRNSIRALYLRPTNPLYFAHPSYLRLRLVNRTFNDIVKPFIYEDVEIDSLEASLTRLTNISNDTENRCYVKNYTYTFVRELFLPGMAQEYTYIMSLPEDQHAAAYQHLGDENIQKRLTHYGRQMEFTNIEEASLAAMDKLPNVEKLVLKVPPNATLIDVPYRDGPYRTVKWGPVMFQTFLKIAGLKARSEHLKSVKELEIYGVTHECLIMAPSTFRAGLEGMGTVHNLSLHINPLMPEPALTVLARLLHAAKELRSLYLDRHQNLDQREYCTEISLRSVICPPRLNRSCSTREPVPPPVVLWPHLSVVHIGGAVFSSPLIVAFLEGHAQTLTSLSLRRCIVKPTRTYTCPHHNHPLSSPDHESERDRETETWPYILRRLHQALPKPLKFALFHQLIADSDLHPHFPFREAVDWAKHLTGRMAMEPDREECLGEECFLCNPTEYGEDTDPFFGPGGGMFDDDSDLSDETDDSFGFNDHMYPGDHGLYDDYDDDDPSDHDTEDMDDDHVGPAGGMVHSMLYGAIQMLNESIAAGQDLDVALTQAIQTFQNADANMPYPAPATAAVVSATPLGIPPPADADGIPIVQAGTDDNEAEEEAGTTL